MGREGGGEGRREKGGRRSREMETGRVVSKCKAELRGAKVKGHMSPRGSRGGWRIRIIFPGFLCPCVERTDSG